MSTKVYEAYRLKDGVDIWSFSRTTYKRAVKNVKEKLWEHALRVIDYNDTTEKRRKFFVTLYRREPDAVTSDMLKKQLTPMDAMDFLHREYGDQLTSTYKNPYNFDVSISFRQGHDGGVYLIPHVGEGMHGVLDFLRKELKEKDPEFEDFCYWNNTDEPEGMDHEEWEARGDVWDELDKNWQFMLVLDIVSFNGFTYISPVWDESYQKRWKERTK